MKTKTIGRQLSLGWIIGYLLLILVAYLFPFRPSDNINKHHLAGIRLDYILHALMFLPLTLLVTRYRCIKERKAWTSLLLMLLIAMAFEMIHLVLPYRSFSGYDLFANIVGTLMGFTIGYGTFNKNKNIIRANNK